MAIKETKCSKRKGEPCRIHNPSGSTSSKSTATVKDISQKIDALFPPKKENLALSETAQKIHAGISNLEDIREITSKSIDGFSDSVNLYYYDNNFTESYSELQTYALKLEALPELLALREKALAEAKIEIERVGTITTFPDVKRLWGSQALVPVAVYERAIMEHEDKLQPQDEARYRIAHEPYGTVEIERYAGTLKEAYEIGEHIVDREVRYDPAVSITRRKDGSFERTLVAKSAGVDGVIAQFVDDGSYGKYIPVFTMD